MASLFENLPPHRPRNSQHADLLLQDARAHDAVVPLIDAHQAFFAWLVEGSPFLARLMRRYPDVLLALQDAAPEDYLDTLYANLDSEMADIADNDAAMALLRHARNRAALAIALAFAKALALAMAMAVAMVHGHGPWCMATAHGLVPSWTTYQINTICRLLISQDVGKMGFRQISLNIYILYQK